MGLAMLVTLSHEAGLVSTKSFGASVALEVRHLRPLHLELDGSADQGIGIALFKF